MRVPAAGEPFEAVEVPIPEPSATEVRVAVEACGICHSDAFVKSGAHPAVEYPRIPGHEIAGRIDAVGDDVERWEPGDRVGVGWHGGHCFTCDPCRRGDFQGCERGDITGLTFDGGYAEYATVPAEAVGAIPDALGAVEAAPLLCAGITTFNALRNAEADPGDLVAVQGIGGLGHLGLQYAHEMGFETVALSRSADKESLATSLGADHFVDTSERDAGEALQSLLRLPRLRTPSPRRPPASAVTDRSSRSACRTSQSRSTCNISSAPEGPSRGGPPDTPPTGRTPWRSAPSGT